MPGIAKTIETPAPSCAVAGALVQPDAAWRDRHEASFPSLRSLPIRPDRRQSSPESRARRFEAGTHAQLPKPCPEQLQPESPQAASSCTLWFHLRHRMPRSAGGSAQAVSSGAGSQAGNRRPAASVALAPSLQALRENGATKGLCSPSLATGIGLARSRRRGLLPQA